MRLVWLAARVKVTVPECPSAAVIGFGVSAAVTAAVTHAADKPTSSWKPFDPVAVTV
jgi:hypothetical protein